MDNDYYLESFLINFGFFRGAQSHDEPKIIEDKQGEVVVSAVKTYGETIYVFVERKNYKGVFLPAYVEWNSAYASDDTGLLYVDHIVGNVNWDEMD